MGNPYYPRLNDVTRRFEIVRNLNGDGSEREVAHVFPEGTTNAACCAAFDVWVSKGSNLEDLNGGSED